MANFDPYHIWLGIPAAEQPPHHYRLLGLQLFEAIPDVIESAADRQMQHLRSFQAGQHAAHSQKLLNEVAAAKICLLNPGKKQEYDHQLRVRLTPTPAAPAQFAAAPQPVVARYAQPLAATPAPVVDAEPFIVPSTPSALAVRKLNRSTPMTGCWIVAALAVGSVALIVVLYQNKREAIDAAKAAKIQPQAPVAAAPAPPPAPTKIDKPTKSPAVQSHKPLPTPELPKPVTPVPPLPEVPTPNVVVIGDNNPSSAAAPRKLLPVPNDDALAAVRDAIESAHGDEVKAARQQVEKRGLAQRFLSLSLAESVADKRYGLLRRTIDIANDAGAYDVATQAIDTLSREYELDCMKLREEALDFADRLAKSPEERRRAVDSWRELSQSATRADDYAAAQRAGQKAADIARGLGDKALLKQMVDALDEIKQVKVAADNALAARDQLKANPSDKAAAVQWGRYCCLYKNDWETGLPLLAANGSDELAELAKADRQDPRVPADQAKLGDKWWFAAVSQSEALPKKNMQSRAVSWYRRAAPWLDGPQRKMLDERMGSFDQKQSLFQLGKWVELLPKIDPARHAQRGNWQKQGEELIVLPGDQTRCVVPVTVDGAYDVEIRFSLKRGLESNVVLPVGDRYTLAIIGGWGGRTSGLHLQHARTDNNSSTVRQHPPMRSGAQQRIYCRVRPAGENVTVEVDVNARPLIRWTGPIASLEPDTVHALGLHTHQTAIQYHSVRLKLISGKAAAL